MIEAGDIQAPNLRLSQARQAQKLSTADVARRLKLSVWQIEALESGQYHQFPGPIFVRGFIRNYARLLGLDPEELANAVGSLLPQPAPPPDYPPSRDIPFPRAGRRRWPRYAVPAAAVVALLAVYEFFFSDATDTVATPSGRLAALPSPQEPRPAAPSAKPREDQARRPASTIAPSPKAQGDETRRPAASAAPSPPVAAATPATAPASASVPGERIAHPDDREVRFVFNEESWVEIRDRNDQTIFAQLNRAGTTRRVVGLPPLQVVVGNSQGVRMTYGGREVDLARHTKIDVARLRLE